jgi:hypothetical protein
VKYKPVPSKNPEWPLPYFPYFTHDCLVNDWPPGWLTSEWGRDDKALSQRATENREQQQAKGNMGTIVGLSDKSDARLRDATSIPGWLKT